jgi:hypothetical protein
LLIEGAGHDQMFLRDVYDRVDVKTMIAEVALLDLEGCLVMLIVVVWQLDLVNYM